MDAQEIPTKRKTDRQMKKNRQTVKRQTET